jgi:protoporphyrinogen oxidase
MVELTTQFQCTTNMNKTDLNLHIIGAGVSGLVAAHVLEKQGIKPTIIEAYDRVGGRVKTDVVSGYQLDHGFQVLLNAYPVAKKYLDYAALELQAFLPGAVIFKDGKQKVIGDPMREASMLLSTVFSGIGTVADKVQVLRLNQQLKNKTIDDIFADDEQTTLAYLKAFGFSEKMIHDFFKPFFTGIFLESELSTSSRMFEFVYKMFGEGLATLPKGGIEAIPNQLAARLKKTTFQFNTRVQAVRDGEIVLADEVIKSDYTIIATEASGLMAGLENQQTKWKSCHTFYFEVPERKVEKPLIGLIPDIDAVINNICYPTSLKTKTKGNNELLSVTVVDDQGLSGKELLNRVTEELSSHCGISSARFLKQYEIPKALPDLTDLQYEVDPSETQLTDTVFLAGDTQLNGSLNAAMIAGERAAMAVLEKMKTTNS